MSNYVSSKTKFSKGSRLQAIIDHNDRTHKPNYLLPEEYWIYKNESFCYGDNLKSYFNSLVEQRKENSVAKSNIRKNENQIVESVVALSEEQALKYLNNGESFLEAFKDIANTIKSKYGLEPMQIDLHCDEGHIDKNGQVHYNIHAHIIYYNFDFDKKRSVLRTMHKKDFADMQDLSENCLQKHDFNFMRGISKEITGVKGQNRNDFIISKQQKEINLQKQELDKLFNSVSQGHEYLLNLDNQIEDKTKLISEQDNLIKEAKKERERVQADTKLSIEEKKLVYKDITIMQNKHRTLRKLFVKEKQEFEGLRRKEKERFLNLINKSKNAFRVIDEDKLATNLMNEDDNYIAMANTLKAKNDILKLTKEVEYYKRLAGTADILNKEIIKKDNLISNLEVEKDDLKKEVKFLRSKNLELNNKVDNLNKELKQEHNHNMDRD